MKQSHNSSPLLSIIILSYNTKALTLQCLESLYAHELMQDKEVLVWDNASTDGSAEAIAKAFSDVRLIKSQDNLGFAGGNNQAAKKARGKYLCFLNSDTYITYPVFTHMLDMMQALQWQLATPLLVNRDFSPQSQGGALPTLLPLSIWAMMVDDLPFMKRLLPTYQQSEPSFFTQDRVMGWVSAASLLIDASLFQRLKGFDKALFMYGEDVDLCWRASRLGHPPRLMHEPFVVHLQHQSSSADNAYRKEFLALKHLIMTHYPHVLKPLGIGLLKIAALVRILLFGMIVRDVHKATLYRQIFTMV